jgi:hypothetical protein
MHRPMARLGAPLVLLSLSCGDPGSPDTQAPSIIFVSPRDELLQETVTIAVEANDDRGVAGVRFWLNGAPLGVEDQVAPYMTTWNTLNYADGYYTLTVTARDAAGNESTTPPLVVRVINGPPGPG